MTALRAAESGDGAGPGRAVKQSRDSSSASADSLKGYVGMTDVYLCTSTIEGK